MAQLEHQRTRILNLDLMLGKRKLGEKNILFYVLFTGLPTTDETSENLLRPLS